jgi:signal recognition particle subunit SRP54
VDLEDLRRLIAQVREMGPIQDELRYLPALDRKYPDLDCDDVDRQLKQMQGIIESMTLQERRYPDLVSVPNRCLRIADGAGVPPSQVSSLFAKFQVMRRGTLPF